MIDLHSHILPGLDDGAQNLQESLAMARMAVDSGIHAMVATPHCAGDRRHEAHSAWVLLREAIHESQIPLHLFLGMEIFGTPDTARMLQEGELLTLNATQYPLIEFSFRTDGREETSILYSICRAGFRPVVAHPERYAYIQEDPRILNDWCNMGCLLQVNRGSLMGRFGRRAQEMAVELVNRNFVSVIASDAHSPNQRAPWLKDVRQLLAKEVSREYARALLHDNPKRIIKNEDVHPAQPEWF